MENRNARPTREDFPTSATIEERVRYFIDRGEWARDDYGLVWASDSDPVTGAPLRTWHRVYFQEDPPMEGIEEVCPLCNDWGPQPPGKEHLGWRWWRTCSDECTCIHHIADG
jgi:hypothetical protein